MSIAAVLSAHFLYSQIEPAAGTWQTWVVPAVARIRLPSPPNAVDSAAEIQTIKTLMAESNADIAAQIGWWDAGAPGYRFIVLPAVHGVFRVHDLNHFPGV